MPWKLAHEHSKSILFGVAPSNMRDAYDAVSAMQVWELWALPRTIQQEADLVFIL